MSTKSSLQILSRGVAGIAVSIALLPSVLAAPAAGSHTIMVAADGSGQFTTIQAAIDSLTPGDSQATVIRIKPGTYKEQVVLGPTHPHVTLEGAGGPAATETTVLTFDNSARTVDTKTGKPLGTSNSASVTLEADDFTARDLTFENSAGPGTKVGQAVAVKVSGDRCAFLHCRFLGWQDTLYANAATPRTALPATVATQPRAVTPTGQAPNGAMPGADRMCRQYYRDCYIAGSVDFIFGSARALFEHCILCSRGPGAVTAQARTSESQPGGYVFHDCDLTAEKDVPSGAISLGRPWRPYARVVYIGCRMGPQIDPKGWGNWNDPAREKTVFYAESDCTGPGADRAARVSWEHPLTAAETAEMAPSRFLTGSDGWHPETISANP